MSKIILCVFLLLLPFFLFSQKTAESEIADSSGVKIFLMAGVNYGVVYEHQAFTLNISGGFDYNNFYFGGFGSSIINKITVTEDTAYLGMQVDLGYGGLIVGYNFFTAHKIHFFLTSMFGWGTVSLSGKETINKVNFMERYFYDSVFLITPTALLETAVISNSFYISTGINYTFMTGLTSLQNFSNKDFSGINYIISLKYHL